MAITKVSRSLLNTGVSDSSDATAITIDSSENVGLGGTPVTQLHVMGGNGVIFDNPNNGYSGLKITDDTSGDYNINFLAGRSQGNTKFRFYRYGRDQNTTPWSDYSSPIEIAHISGNSNYFAGKVGIGTSSPETKVEISGSADNGLLQALQITNTDHANGETGQKVAINFKLSRGGTMRDAARITAGKDGDWNDASGADSHLAFDTTNNDQRTERMRLDKTGALLVGTTSQITSSEEECVHIKNGDGAGQLFLDNTRSSGSQYMVQIHRLGTRVGSIQTTTTTTSYLTTSDYRAKENVDYEFNALERVAQLKPARFNFIIDPDVTVDGFLAHEVSDIVPEAITGEKDAVKEEEYEITPAELNEDGDIVTEAVMGTRELPDYQGIDQSKLVPLLTKAIQELSAKVEELQSEINTLKGE